MAFGKISKNLGKNFNSINNKFRTVFVGKRTLKPGQPAPIATRVTDIGINGLLDLLSAVDLCSILQYALNQLNNSVPQSEVFDPTNRPSTTASYLVQAKWNVQKKAFDLQLMIDNYNGETASIVNKTKLNALIQDVATQLESILNPNTPGSTTDPDLLNAFPALGIINNFLRNSLGFITATPDVRNIPNADIQKIIKYIDNIRGVCVRIQALQSPSSAAASFLSAGLQAQLKQIEKVINPRDIVKALKSIQQAALAIRQVVSIILSIVNTAQIFIKIIVILIKVFKVIIAFLKILPIPNIFTAIGITNTSSDGLKKLDDKIKESLVSLESLATLLQYVVQACTGLITDISNVISKIDLLLINLDNCNCAPEELVNEIRATREELNNTKTKLESFVNNYNAKKENKNKSIGKYSIVIETEKTAVNNSRLLRRYGIALDINGILAAQSTPTFASDDNIIIQEVKLILASKGLIPNLPSPLSIAELNILENALAFLEDDSLSADFSDDISENIDSPDNEDENQGLGLNAFVNKLSGGKRLRKRMRERMAGVTQQLRRNINQNRG